MNLDLLDLLDVDLVRLLCFLDLIDVVVDGTNVFHDVLLRELRNLLVDSLSDANDVVGGQSGLGFEVASDSADHTLPFAASELVVEQFFLDTEVVDRDIVDLRIPVELVDDVLDDVGQVVELNLTTHVLGFEVASYILIRL